MFYSNYQKALTDIKSRIGRLMDTNKPHPDFLYANISDFRNGPERSYMLVAQKYYVNEPDILDRKRYFINRNGVLQEATNLTNAKLAHPSLRKLVKQKVNYLLSKEFSVQTEDKVFSEKLDNYLTKAFYKLLKNYVADGIVNGIAYLQPYYDPQGNLMFKRLPPEEVVPFWRDAEHTILDAFIRFYIVRQYLPNGSKKEVTKVEYYTPQGTWYFVEDAKGLIPDPDPDRGGLQGHFKIRQQQTLPSGETLETYEPVVWDRIPLIPVKYNAEELPLLKMVKPLLDDYDTNCSDISNTLQDIPNNIKVVKNYDGTDKAEFTHNLAVYRTAFVSGDGDMYNVETKLDTAAVDSHLNRLRKDIYEAGSGVDTQASDLGNASGVALKFRYADLDIDSDDLAMELSAALEQLLWFIQVDLTNRGEGNFFEVDFDIIFNTDGIINESEIINDAKNSSGIISEETIMINHPWVTDPVAEKKRLDKEKKENLKQAQDMMQGGADNNFGTENPTGTNTEDDDDDGDE